MKFKTTLSTDGNGLWSALKCDVKTTHLEVSGFELDGEEYGELRVYFDTKTWNTDVDGMIYTDDTFEDMLRVALFAAGLTGIDVGYSEAGMQGDDYVSLDVGSEFMEIWNNKWIKG